MNNGGGTFAAPVNYSTGSTPYGIVTADFNGDGHPDLAVINEGSNTMYVYLNNGDGTFASPVSYATGASPFYINVADFNGDGKPDLAVINHYSNTVSIFLNNSNGTFAAGTQYAVGAAPIGMVIANFNGYPSIALPVISSNNMMAVLLNNGNGTFSPVTQYTDGAYPNDPIAADFNGDGKPDLAVTNLTDNTVSILMGNGDGTFATPVNYPTGRGPSDIITGNFGGNGKPDFAIINTTDNTISFFLNNGNGTFATRVDYLTGGNMSTTYSSYIAAADFNGDGKPDFLTTNISGNNNPGGTSQTLSILNSITSSFSLSFMACNAGGTVCSTSTSSPITVTPNQATNVSWLSSNASSCTVTNTVGTLIGSTLTSATTTATTTTSVSTAYTLQCLLAGGGSMEAGATVNVGVAAPLLHITACNAAGTSCNTATSSTPAYVASGSATNLSWSSSNTSACAVTDSLGTFSASGVSGATTTSYSNTTANDTYTLQCNLPAGGSTQAGAAINLTQACQSGVGAAPNSCSSQCVIDSSASSVVLGSPVTISWCCPSGSASGSASSGGGTFNPSGTTGSQSVTPTQSGTATYSLACASGSGNSSVNVQTLPNLTSQLIATPSRVRKSSTSVLNWDATGLTSGTSCSIASLPGGVVNTWNGSGTEYKSPSGGWQTAAITQQTIFTLSCTNAAGTTISSATVNLVPSVQEI
jgi:hypothetical protein